VAISAMAFMPKEVWQRRRIMSYIRSGRTINFAIKELPEKCRKPFLRAWDACNCADIYNGDLSTYLSVIAQYIERRNTERKALKDIAKHIRHELGKNFL